MKTRGGGLGARAGKREKIRKRRKTQFPSGYHKTS